MASTINASTVSGIVQSADTSGVLALQTGGTTALSIDTSQNVTFTNGPNLPNTFGFKNRIINGAMRIQQRGNGAVTTPGSFPVDRFFVAQNSSSTWSAQAQGSGPTGSGFINSVQFTQTTGQSVSAGNITEFIQRIEGNNVVDLSWGTSSAQPVTLSFWVKCSLTGTFGVSFINSAYNRSYVASYTINSANTWEFKTISIAGDQSGTWVTDTGIGINVGWDLGVGTTFSTSAGSWSTGDYEGLTGGVKLAATTGATWSITGVQLEKGSTATSFDFRDYGRELMLCQRYYQIAAFQGTAASSGEMGCSAFYKVVLRASPTLGTVLRPSINYTGTDNQVVRIAVGPANVSGVSYGFLSDNLLASIYATGLTSGGVYVGSTTASAEL